MLHTLGYFCVTCLKTHSPERHTATTKPLTYQYDLQEKPKWEKVLTALMSEHKTVHTYTYKCIIYQHLLHEMGVVFLVTCHGTYNAYMHPGSSLKRCICWFRSKHRNETPQPAHCQLLKATRHAGSKRRHSWCMLIYRLYSPGGGYSYHTSCSTGDDVVKFAIWLPNQKYYLDYLQSLAKERAMLTCTQVVV